MLSSNRNIAEIEYDLEKCLKECNLDTLIDVNKIRKWIQNLESVDDDSYLRMTISLLQDDKLKNQKLIDKLIKILFEFYSHIPSKFYNNKTPAECDIKDEVKNRSVIMKIKQYQQRAKLWNLYNEFKFLVDNKKFYEARKKLEEIFEMLIKEKITSRGIYHVYGIAGALYLVTGEPLLSERCWNIALELNPNYSYARKQLKRLETNQLDNILKAGMMDRFLIDIKEWFAVRESRDYLNIDTVLQWPEEKILKQLSEFNIIVDRQQFIEMAKKCYSTDDIADQLFYPQSTASGHDQDFIWNAALALWKIYCPDEPVIELLNDIIVEAHTFICDNNPRECLNNPEIVSEYENYLAKIRKILLTTKENFLEKWFNTYGYTTEQKYNLIYFLWSIAYCANLEKPVIELVEYLKSRLPEPYLEFVNISIAIHKKDQQWMCIYESLRKKLPYEPLIPYTVAEIFVEENSFDNAEYYYLKSLEVIDSKVENKILPKTVFDMTIYDEYMWLLKKLKSFYKDNKLHFGTINDRLKMVEKKIKEVEKKFDEYSQSPPNELLIKRALEHFTETENERMRTSLAVQYYDFLKNYEINFRTEDDTEKFMDDEEEEYVYEPKPKIGRNEPCPCGSGKKYKKCCLRYD